MLSPRPRKPPVNVLVIQRNVGSICYRRISNVLKERQLGAYTLLLVKAQHVFYVIEARTGLYLGKGAKLADVLLVLAQQDANRLRVKLEELPLLLNAYKRRVYECI